MTGSRGDGVDEDGPVQLDLFAWSPADAGPAQAAPGAAGDPEPALLRREDPARNMRRFYGLALALSLWGEWGVVRRWGRVGGPGWARTDWHGSREDAAAELARMAGAKRQRGYQ